jgi:hypothetical protein
MTIGSTKDTASILATVALTRRLANAMRDKRQATRTLPLPLCATKTKP